MRNGKEGEGVCFLGAILSNYQLDIRVILPHFQLVFHASLHYRVKLNQNLNSEDEVIKDMVTRTKIKFEKYWSDYCVVLTLGCVLDPRTKLKFLSFCYRRMYPNDCQEKVDRVKNTLYTLFSRYIMNGTSNSIASHDMSHMIQSSPHGPMTMERNGTSSLPSIFEEFEEEMSQETRNDNKSQLDTYLGAKIVGNDKDLDVRQYWKMNKYRFRDLVIKACVFYVFQS
ncbi:Zinc finger BED domain-containing protein DAYSLEEPER [Abeliophyllum distichum]|uniref:Zinc finger BED domain-containing protein DAYSLEEPER n=1 Tax=Abeliophyllum distichum TaxID=126358 RepID=A0ABD1V6G2_9LAMI